MKNLPAAPAALALCLLACAALAAEAPPVADRRATLAGTWSCPKAAMLECGPGPTELKLKADGVYVIAVKPEADRGKHAWKQYGRWEADDRNISFTPSALQQDGGKLIPSRPRPGRKRPGLRYSLADDGRTLTVLENIVFSRNDGQAPAAAVPGPSEAAALTPFDRWLLKRREELKPEWFVVGGPRDLRGRQALHVHWEALDGTMTDEDVVTSTDPVEAIPGKVDLRRSDWKAHMRWNAAAIARATWTVKAVRMVPVKGVTRRQPSLDLACSDPDVAKLVSVRGSRPGHLDLLVPDGHPQRAELGRLRPGAVLRFRAVDKPRRSPGGEGLGHILQTEADFLVATVGGK